MSEAIHSSLSCRYTPNGSTMKHLFDHHRDLDAGTTPNARSLPAHGGVYLIVDGDDRPLLLASGENLRRIVVNRLTAPPADQKTRRPNLARIARRVYWRDTFGRFETALAHWQIARVLEPKTYRKTILFPRAWFLRVDLQAPVPRFTAVHECRTDAADHLGPIATRHDAEEWIDLLEDLFDLCRYHHILEQAPHGQACAYFEMGKCPAPCDGSTSIDAYRRMMAAALAFSLGDHEPRLTFLREAMQSAAKATEFEKAASIRQTIERATARIKKPEYRHLAHLATCCWLIIQRGGPARRTPKNLLVKPFFVRCGEIEVGEPVPLPALESVVSQWLARCGPCFHPPPGSTDEQTARCEALWLVAKFLFQADRAPGLFHRFDRLPDEHTLIAEIHTRFSPAGDTHETPADVSPG